MATRSNLAVIMHADVVGSTALVQKDERVAHERIQNAFRRLSEFITAYGGVTHEVRGDALVAVFGRASDGVAATLGFQVANTEQNAELTDDIRPEIRVGIALGEVVVADNTVTGPGVVLAQRIEQLAEPGSLCISAAIHEAVPRRLPVEYKTLGDQSVKGFDEPVRVYSVSLRAGEQVPEPISDVYADEAKPSTPVLALPDRPSIAVLPFNNLSSDPEQDFLADGLRIDIQNALVKVSGVFLIAAGSANAYRGKPTNQATTDLGVRFALAGSVRRAGERVRISLTLTDEAFEEIVWAEQYDRQLDDAFALLDEITGNVLTALNVKLVAGESAKVWHKTLKDLRSLEAFYRGIHAFFNMDQLSLSEARRHFELVSKLHPEASIGPTWVALTHWYDYQRGWSDSPDESKRLAKDWAEKGAALPDTDGQAFTVLSHLHLLDRDFDAALTSGRNAVSNRPNCTHANAFYANVLLYCCEHETALHHIKLAMRYSPIHPVFFKDILAAVHRALGDLDRAEKVATAAIATDPKDLIAQLILTSLAVKKNESEKWARITKYILDIDPTFSTAKFAEAQPYRNQKFLDEFVADLRCAGLPE